MQLDSNNQSQQHVNNYQNTQKKVGSNITAYQEPEQQLLELIRLKSQPVFKSSQMKLILPYNVVLKWSVKACKQNIIQINGYMCFMNGSPICLGKYFSASQINKYLTQQFTIDIVDKTVSMTMHINRQEQTEDTDNMIKQIIQKLVQKNTNNIQKILIICGVIRKKGIICKKLKKYKLLVRSKLQTVLSHKNQICCSKELCQQLQQSNTEFKPCIENISSIKLNNTDPQYQVIRRDQNYSSQIYKHSVQLTKPSGIQTTEILALKQAPISKPQNTSKLIKEQRILKQLKQAQYLPKYYINPNQPNSLWMDYIPSSLQEKYIKNTLSTFQKIDILKQLTSAIIDIHSQGIVHRDLKPNNILIKQRIIDQQIKNQIKIIDFGESIQCWKEINKKVVDDQSFEKLGATLPYSPLECSVLCPDGYSKLKIDNWSIGILMSQAMIGRIPLCYTKCHKDSIRSGWISSDFNYLMNLKMSQPMGFIPFTLKIISLELMKLKYRQRLCLSPVQQALSFCCGIKLSNFFDN